MSLRGIVVMASPGGQQRPLAGLRGLSVAVEGNLSVKVMDYKGRGVDGVKITTPTGKSFFTDALGNAFILVEGVNVQVTLTKYKVKKVYNVPNGEPQVSFRFGRQVLR